MKYKIGYVYNGGYGERGEEDIRCCHFVGLEQGEAEKPPTVHSVWKRLKNSLADHTVLRKIERYDNKPLKSRKLQRKDIYVVSDPESHLFKYTFIHDKNLI